MHLLLPKSHAGGNDYNEISNFGISFFSRDLPGTERCTNIRINEDTILEYNETFDIVLSEDSARLEIESGRNITKITILEDNDGNYLSNVAEFHLWDVT